MPYTALSYAAIPAGTRATTCRHCGGTVYLVPRPSGVAMAVEIVRGDPEGSYAPSAPGTTPEYSGFGVAHLPRCAGDARRSRRLTEGRD